MHLGPEVVGKVQPRSVEIALEQKVASGRKLRVATRAVETNLHSPAGSRWLGEGVRVWTRVRKKVGQVAGPGGTPGRDRMRSVKLRVLAIARAGRNKTESGPKKVKPAYAGLPEAASRAVGPAQKCSPEIAPGLKRGNRQLLRKAEQPLDERIRRVPQVLRQTRQRGLHGHTRAPDQLVSAFAPQTEILRTGKAQKPNELGNSVKLQEVENRLLTNDAGLEKRPADST